MSGLRLAAVALICLLTTALFADEPPQVAPDKTAKANSLAYLDESNPWYPHKDFPKLITPQWVGEEGVEAVIVLAIDDMRDPAKYEQYLRPILNRLKQIDGRAPVSIMTNEVKPDDPQLQSWLGEGLSIECHTIDHPCPILQGGDFAKAKSTYDRCVDLMGTIPGNKPVAFRTPCCDSLNTVSPRFFSEIFSKTTEKGNFLQIDSSVFTFFTSEDESLPKELVRDANGKERFWKYLPKNNKYGGNTHDNFVNYIKNYPYPYVINNSCWEIPCLAPSDWSAQHLHGINNPVTVEDWKAAIDLTVHKQGCFSLVFHPHGWIKPEQVVEMIDHAVAKHGNKMKFLNFREVAERLNRNLCDSSAERSRLRLADVNDDGMLDVIDGGVPQQEEPDSALAATKPGMLLWKDNKWEKRGFPCSLYTGLRSSRKARRLTFFPSAVAFFPHPIDGAFSFVDISPGMLSRDFNSHPIVWSWSVDKWLQRQISSSDAWNRLQPDWLFSKLIARDFDGDGFCEFFVIPTRKPMSFEEAERQGFPKDAAAEVWKFSRSAGKWDIVAWKDQADSEDSVNDIFMFPFPDVNKDGRLDRLLLRNHELEVWLQSEHETGWTKRMELPRELKVHPLLKPAGGDLSLMGVNIFDRPNGFFIHDNHFCWINEDTAKLPDLMYRVSFDEVLAAAKNNGDSAAEQRQPIAPGVSPGNDVPKDDKAPEGRHNSDGDDQSAAPSGLEHSSSTETPGSRPGLSTAVAPRLNRNKHEDQDQHGGLTSNRSPEYSPVPIGAAVVDITPEYPVRLTGYGNRMKESEGVAAKIHARALVIGGSPTGDLAAEQRQPISPGASPGNEIPNDEKAPEGRHNEASGKQPAAPSGLEDSSSTEPPGLRPGLSAAVAPRLNADQSNVAVSLRRDERDGAPPDGGTPAGQSKTAPNDAVALVDDGARTALISAERDGYTVLITVDNCGVPLEMTEAVYERIAAKYNIPRQNFAISSTHTHSGPWLRGFAPNIFAEIPDDYAAHLAQYEKELTEKLVEVVEKAIASQRPGHLSYGFGEAGFAMNRRALADGKWSGFGEVPDGPTDKRVPVLAAHDVEGKLIAVLANYACHCTTETGEFNQISGDWAGFAADMLEADHPGAVALIAIGCGADANPSPRGTHEQAKVHGRTLADEVNRLLASGDLAAEQRQPIAPGVSPGNEPTNDPKAPEGRHNSNGDDQSAAPSGLKNKTPGSRPGLSTAVPPALKAINPDILCNMARIDLPLGPIPTRETWEQQAKEPGVTGSRARYFLQMLDEGKPIPTTIPNYPVQTWCFGDDLAMVFLGGEVVVDYSIRMNDMFDSDRLWINAYSNDVPCYIASARVLREGGYECDSSMLYYRRPTRLAPEAEDVLCDAVQKIMPHKFYSEKLQQDFPAPKSPEESLKCMTTKPDLRVVLAASEPLIRDPVAFDWDERGRLWVVEMGDYPSGDSLTPSPLPRAGGEGQGEGAGSDNQAASSASSPVIRPSASAGNSTSRRSDVSSPDLGGEGKRYRGRVQMLEDTDKNGVYDKATTFLDNLAFPNGIHCWRGGVIITMAPEIFYAEDTDGDGEADVRETLYKGFVEGNQQHRVNGLRWGLDGWLYLANGDSGGEIAGTGYVPGHTSSEQASGGRQPAGTMSSLIDGTTGRLTPAARQGVNLRGRDLRINPDTNELDAVSGQTQFGRERDDFGNWFGNNNSNPIYQYVLEDQYVRRNPHAKISQVTAQVSVIPGAAPVYPTSRTLARFNDFAYANRFTSACSTMIYRDNYLGDQYYGNAFTSEPVHNLVSRLVLTRDGYGFKGERAADEQQSEFLASSDNWFRPTMIRTGPDGAIWVADMYRAVIEHPEWIPPEYQRKMNLYAGSDMGRIYRIVPASECCGENVAVSLRRDERDGAPQHAATPAGHIETAPNEAAALAAESGRTTLISAKRDGFVKEQPSNVAVSLRRDERDGAPQDAGTPAGQVDAAPNDAPASADEGARTALITAERDGYIKEQPSNVAVSLRRDERVGAPQDAGTPAGQIKNAPNDATALVDEGARTTLITAERDGYFEQPWNEIPIEALVKRLESPNGWWRDTAQRILMHRAKEATEQQQLVQDLLVESSRLSSESKVQIAATHDTIASQKSGDWNEVRPRVLPLMELLEDSDPRVRQATLRLGLVRYALLRSEYSETVLRIGGDRDSGVKLELSLSLGFPSPVNGDRVLGKLLRENYDDPFIRAAAISSLYSVSFNGGLSNLEGVISESLDKSVEPVNEELVMTLITLAAAMGRTDAIEEPLLALLKSIKSDESADRLNLLREVLTDSNNESRFKGIMHLEKFQTSLRNVREVSTEIARNESLEPDRRAAALRLAVRSSQAGGIETVMLSDFLSPSTPLALQIAAIELIGDNPVLAEANGLTSRWNSLAPIVRSTVVAQMLQREYSLEWLLARMESGQFSTVDLDSVQRDQLIHHRNEAIAARAKKLFDVPANSARSAVVADFKSQISNLKSEISKDEQAAAGKLVFEKRCATCHRLQDIGKEVGADLAALKDRSTDALLTAILDPNKAVESKFLVYTVVTKDGLQHSGMLKGETGGSLTLIGSDGKEITVSRAEIDELIGTQRSLMPEGLEKDLSAVDLANVMAFVQSTGTLWKRFDGNLPQVVKPNEDGTITLPASAAEIYGPNLVFEPKYGNLGFWTSTDDYAKWTFDVPTSGHWTVELDFACDDATAGSLMKFSTGNRMLTARVPGSGNWDNYQTYRAGTIDIHRGRGQLIITAPEKPAFALIDLRAVRLIPPK